tara:strand:+ start:274 stop:528 length:255 start_codon:yes stop_codon:yes gene_type:complete
MDRVKLKRALINETGCGIQHDGWTCGSCFYPLADELNLKEDSHMYWQAVLHKRGDYDDFNEWDYNTDIFPELLNELYNKIGEIK